MSNSAPSSQMSVNGVLEDNTAIATNGALHRTTSDVQASPRVSTVDTDDPHGPKKEQHAFYEPQGAQEFRDYSAPGLDSLHWAGVKKRGDFDARSVASSMNAERDDKSIYEEPAVGAVEEAEEDLDQDADEEGPEETTLPAIPATATGTSVEQENRYPGPDSPRDPESRIAASSVAPSEADAEADASSLRPVPSEDGDVLLDDGPRSARSTAPTESDAIPVPPHDIPGSSAAPSSSAASPRSLGLPPSPLSRASADFEAMHGSPAGLRGSRGGFTAPVEPYRSSPMRKATGADAGGTSSVTSDAAAHEELDTAVSVAASDGSGAPASLPDSVIRTDTEMSFSAAAPVPLIAEEEPQQEVVAVLKEVEAEEVAEEREVEAEEAVAVEEVKKEEEEAKEVEAGAEEEDVAPLAIELPASSSAAAAAATAAATVVEPLEVEVPLAAATAAAAVPPSSVPAAETAAAPAPRPPRVDLGPEWEETFKGLLYSDGIDALGRPVVVLNADAVPANMKSSALTYVKAHLEPLVNAGDYVIVFTARKAKLPSLWIMGAYQTLPRPYRKNVQYVILVRPSAFLKAVLAFMRPFVSKKAGRKIKAVESLAEISEATEGEVTMQSLGATFLEAEEAAEREESAAAAAAAGP